MIKSIRWDWPFLAIIVGLITIGVIMNLSTSSVVGYSAYNDGYFFIKRHTSYLALGVLALIFGGMVPYRWYQKFSIVGLTLATAVLALTLVPGIGVRVLGASRWLMLGPVQVQPVEVMKFFIAVYLATSISNKSDSIHQFFGGIVPILAVIAVPLGILILQPDLGNSLLIMAVMFSVLLISRASFFQLGLMGFLGISAAAASILTHPYQLQRIKNFLDPWSDPLGRNYHIVQSLIAIGSGGITGLGIGESRTKYFYLPLHYTDFIFSIICEEGGLWLGTMVVVLFGAMLNRGFKIVRGASSEFGSYLALSLLLFLLLQALINIGVVTGLFPITGIPLTFISFGGSSLVMSMFFCGVILNISSQQAAPA